MSIIGLGFSLSPWKLVGAESSIQRFRLPPASVHIPHGNFASTVPQFTLIEKMGLEVSAQRFMKHGITETDEDLMVYTFQKGDEILNASVSSFGKWSTGHITSVRLSFRSNTIVLTDHSNQLIINLSKTSAELSQV